MRSTLARAAAVEGGEIKAKGVGNSELTNWRALNVPKEKVQYCGTRIV